MTSRLLLIGTLVLALLVLGGAWGFEIWGGLVPCELCLQQRLPWYGAIPLTLILWRLAPDGRIGAWLVLVLFLVSAGLGLHHVGVEQSWWPGPAACTAPKFDTSDIAALLKQLDATPMVRCDQVPWSLFGISLAGFNLLASLAVVAAAAGVLVRSRRG